MSDLTEFYLGKKTDCEGRWIHEIWNWGDDRLEFVHNYVQWLFPLVEPSNFNPDAPLLTDEDIEQFKSDKLLEFNVIESFKVFAGFLGLVIKSGKVEKADWFESRQVLWKVPNHNWMRITRVLTSLRLLGLENLSQSFYSCLVKLREEGYASENSFEYWKNCVG